MHSDHDGGPGDGRAGGPDDAAGGIRALTPADPSRIGRYALLGRLGSGGMGRVYLARSAGGRTVAWVRCDRLAASQHMCPKYVLR